MVNKLLVLLNDENESSIMKRASIFNMIASILNSILPSLLLLVIARVSGDIQGGMFSIASAFAYQCLSLGNFGTRNYHASDVTKKFGFSEYFFVRVLSVTLMYAMLIYYSFGSSYSMEKALIVLTFGLFKSIDAIEDLVHGEYHRQNRLDVAAILLATRYTISIAVFLVIYLLTKNLVYTSLISTVVSVLIFVIGNKSIFKYFVYEKLSFKFNKIKDLFYILLPLCIANYIRMYACNLPKYTIDACMTEKFQTYFNILIMPVFIITLLSDVIFRPFITRLSMFWNENRIDEFKKLLMNQFAVIIILTIVIIIGGYVIGLRLLEIVYNVNLSNYMSAMIILIIAGGFNTASAFLTLIMTIQSEQKKLVIVYLLCALIGIIIAEPLILNLGINGASILYLIICFLMFLSFGVIAYRNIIKKERG